MSEDFEDQFEEMQPNSQPRSQSTPQSTPQSALAVRLLWLPTGLLTVGLLTELAI
jgi:hypothetical protein